MLTIYMLDPLPHQHKEIRGINGSEELLWQYHSTGRKEREQGSPQSPVFLHVGQNL